MDSLSFTLANHLAANDLNAACLEITLIGPELQVMTKTQIAITGGCIAPKINDESVPMWQTLDVQEDDTISFGKMETGCRAYLSVKGGIGAQMILGSRSTYLRGKFGGIDGRQLRIGDTLEGYDATPVDVERTLPPGLIPQFTDQIKAHVMLGPQTDMFTEKGIDTLLSSQYRVTTEADRMGYRLEGPMIENKGSADIVSDALLPGAIQVPKNGKPILIMQDAQTTGGYPKIAVAISSDLPSLGQARPGGMIEFSEVTLVEAHERLLRHRKSLKDLSSSLQGQS